jgi:hypothetical protein
MDVHIPESRKHQISFRINSLEAGSLAFTDLIFPSSISILKRSVFVPITSSFSYSKPVSRRTFLGNSFLSQLIDREIA